MLYEHKRQTLADSLKYDFIIIGAGIVGLSTAWQLARQSGGSRILLLEKETGPAQHQTGHNSGVIHAGVYYEPGSMKARFCSEGSRATYDFCNEHRVGCRKTGKLLVATEPDEIPRMKQLFERCRENGLEPRMLGQGKLQDLEPAITGLDAFLVEESGIVDFPGICDVMLEQFLELGGTARFAHEVTAISEHSDQIEVHTAQGTFSASCLVACAGLMADRIAMLQGLDIDFRTIPYRGEYYRLRGELNKLISHLVYPIPNPSVPFLGVHLTPMVNGSITVGPNAVQGWKREGYGRVNFNLHDTSQILSFPGFWKVSAANLKHGIGEYRNSLWKSAYLAKIRKYCPRLKASDLEPYPAGVRAMAVTRDGKMVHDFLVKETPRSVHVCNAPSPAATSAIPIGGHICKLLSQRRAG